MPRGRAIKSARILSCDTLVLAVGIRLNIEIARQAGLNTSRGILRHNLQHWGAGA
ncbi:hypothetical protein METHB2_210021 [Candidatus Methylobacter favarea]|uniref:FAD/NAD(P)-binding domain-containing protein n=1 Tax=Candidatus Methylobacter favarea TaxID=2707345 RepID=A0A8S0XS03_9GAMM|nr:hypothetical protein METHB2_210021 [Candidatus Methylobacter favarea]